MELSAQEPPPRPIEVTVAQNLGFGAFAHGPTGGTVTIDPAGSRSGSVDIILLNLGYTYSAAVYRLVANAGTVVSVLNGSDITLTGSNGGTMVLHIGASTPVSPFVINTIPPNYTVLNLGGTLTVGNSAQNPPGAYTGLFYITFIQE
ncbi:MAG: DUF4402 domain-containing protein [Bacteroidales bacterium]|nr:DUF4402 domain-containing protein [Bacteroidales bacterium]MBK8883557.1 DUF4402 domain-containing protein [Bacteroidales bacterium]